MTWLIRGGRVLAAVSLVLSLPVLADAGDTGRPAFVRALDRMMAQLAVQSARASKTIRQAYEPHLPLLVLDRYAELEGALWNGGLAPLPADPLRYNLAPRLAGPFPIGEKDLENQISYIAARPATIGCLLDVASRVTSGPLEITSLVRHTEYQGALRTTNANATTSVPMHTMGLAFDIALVNTPLETVYEIRDVLREREAAGDLLFIGERRQLVFHVVPHPSRLGHFTRIYTQAVGAPPSGNGTHIVAFSSRDRKGGRVTPSVTAEVAAVVPTREHVREWWAVDHSHGDLTVEVTPERVAERAPRQKAMPRHDGSPVLLGVVTLALAALTWRLVIRRPALALLRVSQAGA